MPDAPQNNIIALYTVGHIDLDELIENMHSEHEYIIWQIILHMLQTTFPELTTLPQAPPGAAAGNVSL